MSKEQEEVGEYNSEGEDAMQVKQEAEDAFGSELERTCTQDAGDLRGAAAELNKLNLVDSLVALHTDGLVDPRPFVCFHCKTCEENFAAMQLHIRQAHPGEDVAEDPTLHCLLCGAVFENASDRRNHLQKWHKKLSCSVCDRSFANPASLLHHLRVHTSFRPYKCDLCNKTFPWHAHFYAHMSTVHNPSKEFKCTICEKNYSCSSALRKHERIHNDVFAYECTQCHERFKFSEPFKLHMRKHFDVRPYQCGECGRSFASKLQCKRHVEAHLDVRPFMCSICGKAFRAKQVLERHALVHSDARPWFKCDYCAKRFATKYNLIGHAQKFHNVNLKPAELVPMEQHTGAQPVI